MASPRHRDSALRVRTIVSRDYSRKSLVDENGRSDESVIGNRDEEQLPPAIIQSEVT
jgi:hypothetical protein